MERITLCRNRSAGTQSGRFLKEAFPETQFAGGIDSTRLGVPESQRHPPSQATVASPAKVITSEAATWVPISVSAQLVRPA